MKRIKVTPLDGRKVHNPLTGLNLKEKGETVVPSAYWDRRAASQEVSVTEVKQKKGTK